MKSPKKRILSQVLNDTVLRRTADVRSYERGGVYFENGLVRAMAEQEGTVTAKVRGSRTCRVDLWPENGALAYSCTCPMGDQDIFCKHYYRSGSNGRSAG